MKRRTELTIAIVGTAVVLLALGVGVDTAKAYHEDEMDEIFREKIPGDAAWGVRVDTDGSDFAIDLMNHRPVEGAIGALGWYELDEDFEPISENLLHGKWHQEQNRLVLQDEDRSPDTDVILDWDDDGDVSPSSHPDFISWGRTVRENPDPGSYYFVFFTGGGALGEVIVTGDGGVDVDVREGTPHVLYDGGFEDGDVNVQQTRKVSPPTPYLSDRLHGLRVMTDASVSFQVEDALWGQWGNYDSHNAVCGLLVGPCFSLTPFEMLVREQTGLSRAEISWGSSHGGDEGEQAYTFLAAPSGEYTFTIDHKVDWMTDNLVAYQAYEHTSRLITADVLPPRPAG